ncbi:MAG TPA: phosphatidate cytidylyltransferase [Edaphocola sp.]|nr:phosphatidate cytidylyltransferase [Edaphocola sp.]
MNWPVFFKRLGSAVVFSAIMMAGLLVADPYAIITLSLLIQFLCLREYLNILEKIFPDIHFTSLFRSCLQVLALVVVLGLIFFRSAFVLILLPVPLLILLPAVLAPKTGLKEALVALAGLLYISLPMAALITLRTIHIALPLVLVLMIWMNDTMAYITGSFFGKTPFSEISPKKTWEGTVGGGLLTFIGAGIWAWCSPLHAVSPWLWLSFALITVVVGTAGDLLESKLKRLAGVKDSGNIMPGHGGALDRFDSLLACLPFALLIAVCLWG